MPASKKASALSPKEFYSQALKEAEQLGLEQARELEGLDEEIALFRMMLREALSAQPQDYERLLKLGQFLVRALSTRYRISTQSEEDLYQSVLGVLRGIGGVLFPERFGDEEKDG